MLSPNQQHIHRIVGSKSKLDYLDWRIVTGDIVEIVDIVVYSERGVGRGRLLVEDLIKHMKSIGMGSKTIYAFVRSDNPAIGFYDRLGFKTYAIATDMYGVCQSAALCILLSSED